MISLKMEGFKELESGLKALGSDKEVRKVMASALLKRTFPLVQMAKSLAPKRTGRLAASINASKTLSSRQRRGRAGSKSKQNEVDVFVGPSARHAVLVEFGTSPRVTKSGKSTGQMPPRPFMRPAWESTKDQILSGFSEDLGTEIEKAGERIGRKQSALIAKGKR